MSRPLRISPRAEAQIEQASDWWFENRPAAPRLFDEELERAYETIRGMPGIGQPVESTTRAGVRRLFLGRVRYHVYYAEADDAIEVLAVWHSSRGAEPDL